MGQKLPLSHDVQHCQIILNYWMRTYSGSKTGKTTALQQFLTKSNPPC